MAFPFDALLLLVPGALLQAASVNNDAAAMPKIANFFIRLNILCFVYLLYFSIKVTKSARLYDFSLLFYADLA
ncbi:hypothetical protein Hs20B_08500 [Lactococcus insecticola]|uniref:Uncharacterized protein n=1 Tax=Pseudolactococcus insecticola TaxID=2709158 RepID=A0A6A0B5F1_9LACT|nr:hypothetical protein Hs20B_08500 [Lactococcus insecticola]